MFFPTPPPGLCYDPNKDSEGRHRLGSVRVGRGPLTSGDSARGCVYTGFLPQAQAPRSWYQTLQGTETAREFPPSPQILPKRGGDEGAPNCVTRVPRSAAGQGQGNSPCLWGCKDITALPAQGR